jgi:hypothetical protein
MWAVSSDDESHFADFVRAIWLEHKAFNSLFLLEIEKGWRKRELFFAKIPWCRGFKSYTAHFLFLLKK